MDSKYSSWSFFLPAGVTPDMIGTYLAAFMVIVAVVVVGITMTGSNKMQKIKIRELAERRAELKGEFVSNKKRRKKKNSKDENIEFMQLVVKKLNLLQENKIKDIAKLLYSAGYRNKNATIKYAFAQGVCAFGFLLLSLFFVKIDPDNIAKTAMKSIIPFVAFYTGMMLPKIMVINTRNKRWAEVRKGLPDGLDLMMICTEAGLTLSAALDRVCKELGIAYPELADELALTSIEIGFLPERRRALENFAERVAIPEVKSLTSVLIQTEKYGTPVSQALRVLAKEFREQRMLMAEQKAARLPALMTVPMICFILPTLFIVVISPAMLNVTAAGN